MQQLYEQDPETKSADIVAENIEQLKSALPRSIHGREGGFRGAEAASWRRDRRAGRKIWPQLARQAPAGNWR